ncbi:hypothetical protein, partial [Streptomyces galilaeus]|uniref:hypothetical protein n=1 Tax=Streptomyces galilaeus TaxID=33899 RepID=UPI0038F6CEAB
MRSAHRQPHEIPCLKGTTRGRESEQRSFDKLFDQAAIPPYLLRRRGQLKACTLSGAEQFVVGGGWADFVATPGARACNMLPAQPA